jgi:hypothetical protein
VVNIPRGKDAAITYAELAERLSIPRRSVEEAVRQMRIDGIPLITGNDGVWAAETAQEARNMAERLRTRAIHQMETAQALDRAADAMDRVGQETLWAA